MAGTFDGTRSPERAFVVLLARRWLAAAASLVLALSFWLFRVEPAPGLLPCFLRHPRRAEC